MKKIERKYIEVTCAIIERDGLILAAQRSAFMSMPLKWEFPGGKIHDGESLEACLSRELREELDISISIGRRLSPVTHDYADFTVTLYPFVCAIAGGKIVLHEHRAVKWLLPEKLPLLDWAPADLPIISEYLVQVGR